MALQCLQIEACFDNVVWQTVNKINQMHITEINEILTSCLSFLLYGGV